MYEVLVYKLVYCIIFFPASHLLIKYFPVLGFQILDIG